MKAPGIDISGAFLLQAAVSFFLSGFGDTLAQKKSMVIIVSDLRDYMFSSELTEFSFRADTPVRVQVLYGSEAILDETLVPDTTGMIRIRELNQLIESYLIENLIASFRYVLSVNSTAVASKTFKVQYCKAEVGMDTVSFLNTFFLSTLMGDKVTTLSRKEHLHLVCGTATEVKAKIKYRVGKTTEVVEKLLKSITGLNVVSTIDVSPVLVEEQGKELLGYSIIAGDRLQTFVIDRKDPRSEPDLLFTNSFGCQETIYCRGTFKLESEMERQQAYIDGKYRTYHVNENRKYKANTGVLTTAMANWAEDLFRSKEIYLFDGESIGKEIAITESKFVRSNNPDELPSFNFEYRYAQRNQNILFTAKAGRIFDMTFDRTFN